jgi:hypothetical protein
MVNKIFFLLIFSTLSIYSIAQNYLYIDTRRYVSTADWNCTIKNGYPEFGNASLSVAKNGSGGYFVVSVDTHHLLKGSVLIYLENGGVIKCLDTQIKDQHDGISTGIYNLTATEINQLKNSRISSVRVSCLMYSTSMHSFTIYNYYHFHSYLGDDFDIPNYTEEDVTKLFNY